MADGRARHDWGQTSAVLAMLANTCRDAKKRPKPYRPAEFNPYSDAGRRRRRAQPVSVDRLADDMMRLAGEPREQGG